MSDINWNEAPYWANCAVKSKKSGVVEFANKITGGYFRVNENGSQFIMGDNAWSVIESRPAKRNTLTKELVKNPSHYDIIDDFTTLEMIARSSTVDEFRGFCKGNIIKYRMRVGKKDDVTQEVAKAENYKLIYEDNKHLCYDYLASKS